MATANPIIPIPSEMLKLIPLFGGDKKQLNLFIRKCEYVISKYRGSDEQNLYVYHSITSRLTENAASLLSEQEDVLAWSDLKELLQRHFGDPRSEACISIELESLKIKSGESYLDFCNRIQSVRSLLISKVNATQDKDIKKAKLTIYNNTALNVFLYNLPENLVRIVRLKAPATLEAALSVVLEEMNFLEQYNMRNRFHGQSSRPVVNSNVGPPQGLKFGGSFHQPTGFRPVVPSNTVPQFKFGIPQNAQFKIPQTQGQPQQFGYRPPQQFGYRPPQQFGYRPPQQFGYRPPQQFGDKPPQQFGYKPPQQFGYKPPQQFADKPLQQFGYTPPQVQPPRMQTTDVSMRTAPLRPQPGFKLNELTLNDYEDQYYSDYYQDNYSDYELFPVEYEQNFVWTEGQDETEQTDTPQTQDFCEEASTQKTKK